MSVCPKRNETKLNETKRNETNLILTDTKRTRRKGPMDQMATVLARMIGTDIYVIPGDVMRCDRKELIYDADC